MIISELPPIVKPGMRTQIEEIDGKDGDIITHLGYSAYDKTLDIGLYGDYVLDEVAAYFNSQGTVTFSNEPDKFYKYTSIEQIDFERLVRYKTASVTFHVQPFKYSLLERGRQFDISQYPSGEIVVYNIGNVISKPAITISGSGPIGISINGVQIFIIELGGGSTITIDAERLEAYGGGELKNRQVIGSYDNFVFPPGENVVATTGDVTRVYIENYSRWI